MTPDLTSTIPQLATQFRRLGASNGMRVFGDNLKGLVAYPKGWNGRVMLCAHCDTVKYAHGYDDRAGVAVLFNLMDTETRRFAYAIFMDEETGAAGSRAINLPEVPHIFVGLDRRGINQVAFYDDESREDWEPWVLWNHAVPVSGSFTDCTNLGRRYDRYCFNFSVGFDNEHTSYESYDPRGAEFARAMALRV